jgi:hypothetical protein
MTKREQDMRAEQELCKFLDTYFYEKSGLEFERKSELVYQYKGIDVFLTLKDGSVLKIDEKASLRYINKELNTYSFEINFLNKGGRPSAG